MFLLSLWFVAEIHKFYSHFFCQMFWLTHALAGWFCSRFFFHNFIPFILSCRRRREEKLNNTHKTASHDIRQRGRQTAKRHTLHQAERERGDLLSFHAIQLLSPLHARSVNGIVMILKENMNFIIAAAIINISHVHLSHSSVLLSRSVEALCCFVLYDWAILHKFE